jgi:ABC-type branched-subunit amino acid transport system substrate-binding protein
MFSLGGKFHIGLAGNDFAFKTYLRKWILPAALRVSQPFRDAGGLSGLTGVAVFTPALDKPEVQDFVKAYQIALRALAYATLVLGL